MKQKALIFGVSYSVDSLIMSLLKNEIDLNLEKDYYVNISPPPIPESFDFPDQVISGLFVDVSKDLIKAILIWLREREKEHVEESKLKFCINGNLLTINVQEMQILLKVVKVCSKSISER